MPLFQLIETERERRRGRAEQLARAKASRIVSGGMRPSARGGVLVLQTGDGRTDATAMRMLELPWRQHFGHHRYLLDAVQ